MAYDAHLADRMRHALAVLGAERHHITEKQMMGGVCFFLRGNMIGGADRSKQGECRLMFRVGKGNEKAQTLAQGIPVILGNRSMPGFFFVDSERCDNSLLRSWLELALDHAGSLPPK